MGVRLETAISYRSHRKRRVHLSHAEPFIGDQGRICHIRVAFVLDHLLVVIAWLRKFIIFDHDIWLSWYVPIALFVYTVCAADLGHTCQELARHFQID